MQPKTAKVDNWKDYINTKFTPVEDFNFETEDISNTLRISHKGTGTYFAFIWPSEDWKTFSDLQFYNDKTDGWSGEFGSAGEFSEKEIEQVEKFLEPAFKTGWASKDVYAFGKHWKSEVYWNQDMNGTKFHYYSSDLGCVSVFLLPVSPLLTLFGQNRVVKVDSVEKYNKKVAG